ncbi:MAG: DUF3795 domain-containing protein [Candidatus Thorarchaeota archaeon]|nr:DUF3795 domain-containing protein [Candidatus Thorarchaeota archaeon]
MTEIIAYCGLDCTACDAFKATRTENLEQKKRIAERWNQQFNKEFTTQDIECDGCLSSRISGWCRSICQVRPCAIERGVETCAHCDDYLCEKIERFLSDEPEATARLEEIRRSL